MTIAGWFEGLAPSAQSCEAAWSHKAEHLCKSHHTKSINSVSGCTTLCYAACECSTKTRKPCWRASMRVEHAPRLATGIVRSSIALQGQLVSCVHLFHGGNIRQ